MTTEASSARVRGGAHIMATMAGFTLIILLVALLAAPGRSLGAPAAALARPDPLASNVAVGDVFVVNMYVESVENLYGADMMIGFDPALLQVQDMNASAPGVQIQPLSTFLKGDFVLKAKACNAIDASDPDCTTAGFAWYAATQLNPSPPVSGAGPIAAITFKALQAGVSSLTVRYVQLSTPQGVAIPVTTQAGQVVIGGADPPTPTVTATSTQTPTPTATPTPTDQPGSYVLEGFVFVDANRDGARQPAEAGIPGVVLRLSASQPGFPRDAMTDASGFYRFVSLTTSLDYLVKAFLPPGPTPTTPTIATARFTIGGPQTIVISFGVAPRHQSFLPLIRRH